MRVIITSFLVQLSTIVFGQLEKDTWLVGGNGSFTSQNRDYTAQISTNTSGQAKDRMLSISPNFGYFFADKIAIGLRPFFSSNIGESIAANGSTASYKSKRYGIGPFLRYYFLNPDNPINIVSETSYQLGVWDEATRGRLSNFSILAGPVFYFNTSVGLEILMGYNSRSEELKNFGVNSTKSFVLNIGFQIHLKK